MPASPSVSIEPTPTAIDPAAAMIGGKFNDGLRTRLQAAMDAKEAAAGQPAGESVPPTKPAAPVTTVAPAAPAAPAVPTAPASKLPTADTYVPGQTKSADWDRLKTRATAAESRAEAAEARLKGIPDANVLATLQKERDAYQAQLRSIAIERDPVFDREFATQTATVTALARQTAGPDLSPKVDAILAMPAGTGRDKALEEVMAALPAYKQVMLGTALADMDKINLTKQARIEESRTNWAALQQRALADQAAREAASKAVLDKTLAEWSDPEKGLAFLQRKSDDPAHNERVEGTVALAREIFAGELDTDQMARASIWAAASNQLLATIRSLQTEVETRDARIAELTGVSPGAGDTGTGGTAATTGEDEKLPLGTGYGAAVAAAVRRAGVLTR